MSQSQDPGKNFVHFLSLYHKNNKTKSRNRKVSTGKPVLTLLSVEPCNLKEPCEKIEPCEASNITQT